MSEDTNDGFSFEPFSRNNDLPDGTIVVNTYERYQKIVTAWIEGGLEGTLIVIGAAGVGKSQTALKGFEALEYERGNGMGSGDFAYIKGKSTQRATYEQIVNYKDKPIVLDDVDEMLADAGITGLLKMLLETTSPKIVQWNTAKTLSGDSDTPPQVETNSRTMILANEIKSVTKNFAAVLDRSTIIYFAPKAEEVQAYVKTWFDLKKHKDVYDFVSGRLTLTPSPSCRYYYKAQQWKTGGLPWQEMVDASLKTSDVRATKMKDLIDKHTDPKTNDYFKGAVKLLIQEYVASEGCSEQAAYKVKAAVEKSIGRLSKRGKSITEGMKRTHATKKATPKKPTKKKKK